MVWASCRERSDLPGTLERGGRQLGGGVWKRDQGAKAGEHIQETNESSRGGSQQCRAAPAPSHPRLPLKGSGMGQLAPCLPACGRAQVPTGQSSSGLFSWQHLCGGQAFHKATGTRETDPACSTQQAQSRGCRCFANGGCFANVRDLAGSWGAASLRAARIHFSPCCRSPQRSGPHPLRREEAAVSGCQVRHGNSQKNQFQLLFFLVLVVRGSFCSSLWVQLWLRLTSGSLECKREDHDSTTALYLLFDTLPLRCSG